MGTSAKVIADSVSPAGDRVTTMEVTMHRFVLAEFNTHRVFSRNSASSRAIPLERQIERLVTEPAYPVKWASERPGMQGGDEIDDVEIAKILWREARENAIGYARRLRTLGVHKSIINRLLEPFMWHTVIVTSSEWENFFGLRCHELAQPEIRVAAEMMRDAYQSSCPEELDYGQWHAPYSDGTGDLRTSLMTSVARCAWVSTMSHDGDKSWDAIERMWERLTSAVPMHASPLEHQCTPFKNGAPGNLRGWAQLRHKVERGEVPWRPSRIDRDGDEQPMPIASAAPVAHRMVQADLEDRLMLGVERYGQPLQPFNGRNSLRDAYDEILDLAVYIRNEIYERESE